MRQLQTQSKPQTLSNRSPPHAHRGAHDPEPVAQRLLPPHDARDRGAVRRARVHRRLAARHAVQGPSAPARCDERAPARAPDARRAPRPHAPPPARGAVRGLGVHCVPAADARPPPRGPAGASAAGGRVPDAPRAGGGGARAAARTATRDRHAHGPPPGVRGRVQVVAGDGPGEHEAADRARAHGAVPGGGARQTIARGQGCGQCQHRPPAAAVRAARREHRPVRRHAPHGHPVPHGHRHPRQHRAFNVQPRTRRARDAAQPGVRDAALRRHVRHRPGAAALPVPRRAMGTGGSGQAPRGEVQLRAQVRRGCDHGHGHPRRTSGIG